MMKDRLKPHAFKVKGKNGYLFYNHLTGEIHHLTQYDNVPQIRDYLLKNGLIFTATESSPFKMAIDISYKSKSIHLKELQIKLAGCPEDTCWQRNLSSTLRAEMSTATLSCIKQNVGLIPIERILIDTDYLDLEKISTIVDGFTFSSLVICSIEPLSQDQINSLTSQCNAKNIRLIPSYPHKRIVSEIEITDTTFFYHQMFNPCLGHQAAVDCNGDIKPCIWAPDVLGNIHHDNLKKIILEGRFDFYWEMSMEKIEGCNDCEKRYICSDCRISVQKQTGSFSKKSPFCCSDVQNPEKDPR